MCGSGVGNGVRMIGMTITMVRRAMAALERMPLMIPDLDFCGAVRGSTVRGTVVLLLAAATRPITLTTTSVFGWCAIFPGLFCTRTSSWDMGWAYQ